jgi:hypothetical protein
MIAAMLALAGLGADSMPRMFTGPQSPGSHRNGGQGRGNAARQQRTARRRRNLAKRGGR